MTSSSVPYLHRKCMWRTCFRYPNTSTSCTSTPKCVKHVGLLILDEYRDVSWWKENRQVNGTAGLGTAPVPNRRLVQHTPHSPSNSTRCGATGSLRQRQSPSVPNLHREHDHPLSAATVLPPATARSWRGGCCRRATSFCSVVPQLVHVYWYNVLAVFGAEAMK